MHAHPPHSFGRSSKNGQKPDPFGRSRKRECAPERSKPRMCPCTTSEGVAKTAGNPTPSEGVESRNVPQSAANRDCTPALLRKEWRKRPKTRLLRKEWKAGKCHRTQQTANTPRAQPSQAAASHTARQTAAGHPDSTDSRPNATAQIVEPQPQGAKVNILCAR